MIFFLKKNTYIKCAYSQEIIYCLNVILNIGLIIVRQSIYLKSITKSLIDIYLEFYRVERILFEEFRVYLPYTEHTVIGSITYNC